MTASTLPPTASSKAGKAVDSGGSSRITSIDALRGFVMFTMIFVNDIAGVSNDIVPAWMKHYHGKSGMTFVDLVFPAFLFTVGISIPFALGSRLDKGEPIWKTLSHVTVRTASLLFIGILMVNETPDSTKMGWSGALWCTFMYLSAICAFCTISPPGKTVLPNEGQGFRMISLSLRVVGLAALIYLAFAYRGADGHRIITFSPFSIHTEWYGILGLLGWAYLVGSVVFLIFRNNRPALLACVVLLMCLYPADKNHAFDHFWLASYVGIGDTLGSLASITVAGILLATVLITPETAMAKARSRFALLFIAGFAIGALLLHGLYGINKNNATPSWCLWACAITATLWLAFYFFSDVRRVRFVARPLAIAGQNVLLAYLISEMLPSALDLFRLSPWYGGLAEHGLVSAVARSAGCGAAILCGTATLNRIGFWLRL